MNKAAVLILLSLVSLSAPAQSCGVEVDALKGTYEGDCKKEKAHGKGFAKGEDTYYGEFKNGYPDGNGNYKWKNGDWYEGSWKKGMMEGKGEMHYANKKGSDSLQAGFWKKGKYRGKYENPYVVHSKSPKIGAVGASLDTTLKNSDITFNADLVYGGKPVLTNIEIVNGRFLSQSSNEAQARLSVTILRGVAFPFRARIYYNTEHVVDIELFEVGNWKVDIRIN